MKIVADENIPFAREAFGSLGEVELAHGRKITPAHLADADLLFVRSITKVNAHLLAGSQVRFVGTATAGTDHVDQKWLAEQGIGFASAGGCNANSVAEYMTAAWLVLAGRKGLTLKGMSVGIIGAGHVGSLVDIKARALGMSVILNDPPLARATGDKKYRPLEELMGCDIITFHTPLTKDGPDKTFHLANQSFFNRLKKGCLFCNASRGEVVDEEALLAAADENRFAGIVLDVWEKEPNISMDALARADLGSPHIAGYSYDGKVNGTRMVYEAACRFLERPKSWRAEDSMAAPEFPNLELDGSGFERDETFLRDLVLRLYPIERDDTDLRKLMDLPADQRGAAFDRLRKEYPYRREFQNTTVTLKNGSPALASRIAGLGFQLSR